MTTEQKRERRRMLARLRYANNPETKAKYQAKARARIPVKCEYEKQRRRKEAAEKGREFREPGDTTRRAHRLIMDGYETERKRVARSDRVWHKHNAVLRWVGAQIAARQWNSRKDEPGYRQLKALRTRLWKFVNKGTRGSMARLIGCSHQNFIRHIGKQFKERMTWANYGEWEMDHIVPCTAFDLTKPEEQAKCFHYKNIQPMWKADNIRKGNRLNGIRCRETRMIRRKAQVLNNDRHTPPPVT